MDNNYRKDINNGEPGKTPDKSELFTDKVVIDDTMEIFDLDSHRKQRENAPAIPDKSGLHNPAPAGRPAERRSVSVNPAQPVKKEQAIPVRNPAAKPIQNAGVKPVQPLNVQNAKPQPGAQTRPAQPKTETRTTPPAMPRRMRVISSEVSQSEIFSTPAQPVSRNNVPPTKQIRVQSNEEMFDQVYGKESTPDFYPKKKHLTADDQATAEYDAIFSSKKKPDPELDRIMPDPVRKTPVSNVQPKTAPKTENDVKTYIPPKKALEKPVKGDEDVKIARPRKPANPVNDRPVEPERETKEKVPGIVKALIYIGSVFVVSVILATMIILIVNDVFAFVKDDREISMSINEYATLEQIADQLHEYDVIKFPKVFVLWSRLRHNDDSKYVSGIYTVSPMQNYDELLATFQLKKKSKTFTEIAITIPEGYTVDDIITMLVEEKGIGTKEGFIDAIQNYDYDYWFIDELTDLDPDRKYRLEGYLYPDTYYIYQEWEEWRIINKMLQNFYNKFSIEYKAECDAIGMSVDEVVNLASIIQMEAKYSTEYTAVSSVLHNRLKSSYYRYMLDCDSTIQYALGSRKERLTADDTKLDNQYNSYLYAGLPPGPISNPTIQAIRAALYPDESNYYFFVSDKTGHMLFARTNDEHNVNKRTVELQGN